MRRTGSTAIAVLTTTTALLGLLPAAHAGEGSISFGGRAKHREWVAWAAGSGTNPLLDPTFCGEIIDGRFFLNLANALNATYDCDIPAGVTIVASSGYGIVWKPTDGKSDRALKRYLNSEVLEGFGSPKGRLDGALVDLDPSFAKTGVFNITVGENSLIQTVDKDFPDDRKRTDVAAGAWIFKVQDLSVGDHKLVVRQRVFGQWARAVFNLTIT